MLLSAVSVLVVAQSSSEIPEGLMNNPVCRSVIPEKLGNVERFVVVIKAFCYELLRLQIFFEIAICRSVAISVLISVNVRSDDL